jgi:hypothetical protein
VKLFGVFPEHEISMPKINPTKIQPNELTNGHTHLFMKSDEEAGQWGSEADLKLKIAQK